MVVLDGGPGSAGQARRTARSALSEWGCGSPLVDSVQVVVSELVTNAVLHAGGALSVAYVLSDDAVRVEVGDRSPLLPARSGYGEGASTGRGLGLVASIARRWDVEPQEAGKLVWAEVPLVAGSAVATDPPPAAVVPTEPGAGVLVCWMRVPVDLYQALQEQNDAVQREVDLLLIGGDDGLNSPVPPELLRLCQQLRTRFGRSTSAYRANVAAAARQRQATVDLEAHMPAGSTEAARAYVELFERIEAFARDGHLLVQPSTPEVAGIRRWFAEEMAAQLNGAVPTPFPARA